MYLSNGVHEWLMRVHLLIFVSMTACARDLGFDFCFGPNIYMIFEYNVRNLYYERIYKKKSVCVLLIHALEVILIWHNKTKIWITKMLTTVNFRVSIFRDGVRAQCKNLLYHFSLTRQKQYNFKKILILLLFKVHGCLVLFCFLFFFYI